MSDLTKLIVSAVCFTLMCLWMQYGLGIETRFLYAAIGGMMSIVGSMWIWGVAEDDDDEDDLV